MLLRRPAENLLVGPYKPTDEGKENDQDSSVDSAQLVDSNTSCL
jgi:hypothetical protein